MSPRSPLSPLKSSSQNVRAHSPATPSFTPNHWRMDEIMAADDCKENVAPNSANKMAYDMENDQDEAIYATAREIHYTEMDEETAESPGQAPSSPFRYDAAEETANLQELRERSMSPGTTENLVAPRKRSHDDTHIEEDGEEELRRSHGPAIVAEKLEEQIEDTGSCGDEPDVDVDTDEGASVIHHEQFRGSDRRDIGHSIMEDRRNEGMSTVYQENTSGEKENIDSNYGLDAMNDAHDPMNDTCLSTFSEVPNLDMTLFAGLRRESPTKTMRDMVGSPAQLRSSQYRAADPVTPRTARREGGRSTLLFDSNTPASSPTPRKRDSGNGNGTANLLDFTDQLDFLTRSSQRYAAQNSRYSPSRRSPLRRARESLRSPGKFALLDFDIPPAPTPRSIPTITPRELETLKSGFHSEISSLRATLSGKEAEVASLKQAIADAERRVGEALEEVMNEAARKEALEVEQSEWERRGKEMESVLRGVKAEILEGERERERLTKKIEEAEKFKEQLEGRIVELESQLSASRNSTATGAAPANSDSGDIKTPEEVAKEVQDAVERVARELHSLYRGKHETKVAALKKSYEARWEKRVREAENKWKEAMEENERLKTERDTTMSGPVNPNASMIIRENEEHETEKRVMEAQMKGLQQEMVALKRDSERLHSELKIERAEKGELVAAVDEWLAMQQQQQQQQQQRVSESPVSRRSSQEPQSKPAEPEAETFSRSIGRGGASGIRPPSTGSAGGDRKLGRFGMPASSHTRGNSGSGKSGIAAPTPGRSGIMSSIERMGRGGI